MINEWWIYQRVINVQSCWGVSELTSFSRALSLPHALLLPSLMPWKQPKGKWQILTLHTKMSNWVIWFIFMARKGRDCMAPHSTQQTQTKQRMGFKYSSALKHCHCLMTFNEIVALLNENENGAHCFCAPVNQGKAIVKQTDHKKRISLITALFTGQSSCSYSIFWKTRYSVSSSEFGAVCPCFWLHVLFK